MRILVVEDHQKIAQSIKQALEQEAFAVDVAHDGLEGFDLGAGEDYDLIILDLMLPGMPGEEICKKLREEEKVSTPILMLTAKSSLEDKVNGFNLGADDYLTKPFDLAELLARVKALVRRPKKSLGTVLRSGDLNLDTLKLEVRKGKKLIPLSKKEFALLEYLLRNKDGLVTKNQIINHVWDYQADVLPNTVEVYIGYLRNKIGRDLIKTIRGFGYKMSSLAAKSQSRSKT